MVRFCLVPLSLVDIPIGSVLSWGHCFCLQHFGNVAITPGGCRAPHCRAKLSKFWRTFYTKRWEITKTWYVWTSWQLLHWNQEYHVDKILSWLPSERWTFWFSIAPEYHQIQVLMALFRVGQHQRCHQTQRSSGSVVPSNTLRNLTLKKLLHKSGKGEWSDSLKVICVYIYISYPPWPWN